MNKRSYWQVLLALFAIGCVFCQNEEELPIPVETDNQFPPEFSESDNHNVVSESTTIESTQSTPRSTTNDVSTSTLAEKDNNDEDSDITDAELSESTSESIITDVATTIMTTNITSEINNITIGVTVPELVAESSEPPSELTTAVATLADANNEDQITNNENSETTTVEPTLVTSESTEVELAIPVFANDNEQMAEKVVDETTTAEPTQTTSESAVVEMLAPSLDNLDEHVNNNENIETTTAEVSKITSESTIADLPISSDVIEDVAQTIELTSGSITADREILSTTDVSNNEESETTTTEPTNTTPGSTISDDVATLTTKNEQVSNSETMVVETTGSTPESPNIIVDASKLIDESQCPEPCICVTEGDSNDYIVDCSGRDLNDWPAPIDSKTTFLKLQNNKFKVIPKAISELRNLKNLNANDNLISELEPGSVSELPELVSLTLANNRLLEFPKELENSGNLNKLEELDLAGNDLKTIPDIFLSFKALKTVTLPEISSDLVSQLCSLKESLVTVCALSCAEHSYQCSDISAHNKDSLDAILPGMIPFFPEENTKDVGDIVANSEKSETLSTSSKLETPELTTFNPAAKEIPDIILPTMLGAKEISDKPTDRSAPEPQGTEIKDNPPGNDFSLRNAVNNAPQEKVALQSIVIDTPNESSNNETDVKVGAKTTETKGGGGVDKSVIAVIVAGMIIIVAVITIKKNWSSIRKRFSSAPRATDRSERNANGTTVTPEEVPLQDKSPV